MRRVGHTRYSEEDLYADLTAEGTTMAKVFYYKLTVTESLESLPWREVESPSTKPDCLIISAPTMASASRSPDHCACRLPGSFGSAPTHSFGERGDWVSANQNPSDFVQSFPNLTLPLEAVMAKMQSLLNSLNFQWFHPDDGSLIARGPDNSMYLSVKVYHSKIDAVHMYLYFTRATQCMLQRLVEAVGSILTLAQD
jgi:hypothetical protein